MNARQLQALIARLAERRRKAGAEPPDPPAPSSVSPVPGIVSEAGR
jgi:hypothetical protein